MYFIELTSYLEPPAGFPTRPYFDEDLWPLLTAHAADIERVLLFQHNSHKAIFPPASKLVSRNIAEIGRLTDVPPNVLATLAHLSFYGGHLNVLYEVSSDSPLLERLIDSYPVSARIANDQVDNLGLAEEARSELAGLVEKLTSRHVLLAFAHDGDPLYVFGAQTTLQSLADKQISK